MATTEVKSFLPSDEPESISFQDSLSFFRQQLSNTSSLQMTDGATKAAEKFINVDDTVKNEPKCCRMSIPTVDSILESVRVLRAIQKSQRGKEISEAEKYSTSGVQELLLENDGIFNSLHPTVSCENNYSLMENLLNNNEKSNFWPKTVVDARDLSCGNRNSNKENLKKDCFPCYNLNILNNATCPKIGAISNQTGHIISKDKITETKNLSKPFSDFVSNECSTTDNNVFLVQNEATDKTAMTKETMSIDIVNASERPPNVSQDCELNDLQADYVVKHDQNETQLKGMECEAHSGKNNTDAIRGFDLLSECTSCPSSGYSDQVFSNQVLGEESKPCLLDIHDPPHDDSIETTPSETSEEQTIRNAPSHTEQPASKGVTESGSVMEEGVSSRKFTTSSWDLVTVIKLLFTVQELQSPEILTEEVNLERKVFVLSKGTFWNHSEGFHTLLFKDSTLFLFDEKDVTLSLTHAEILLDEEELTLLVDSKVGKYLHFKCESEEELQTLYNELSLCRIKSQPPECIHLVHYPLKCHQNVVIIDLGSCSTRAGILMDQPTLPTLFFPSVCATNKISGEHVYGLDALEPKERQNAIISFPLRPPASIIKHSVDVDKVTGIFKKIFTDLRIDPENYTVLVCLPRSLSIHTQSAIVNVLLEDFNAKAVSLSHQAILTMYAHNVSTGVVVDIGDRMDVLPVIDGFIVEGGVTRLPYGGQRLIHHMKHALAQKHISLSNDIDSFVVAYISERLSYVARDYEKEAALHPQTLRKAVDLTTITRDETCLKSAVLDDARFKVPEGLFHPDLWGLDSPGIHHLVQKAIQATGVDARKKVAENIYLSGGVTLLAGFVERLTEEVTRLNEPRITPKVYASSYRYHCTFIGACRLAKMDVFPQVCLTKKEYSKDRASSLKKFMLCL